MEGSISGGRTSSSASLFPSAGNLVSQLPVIPNIANLPQPHAFVDILMNQLQLGPGHASDLHQLANKDI